VLGFTPYQGFGFRPCETGLQPKRFSRGVDAQNASPPDSCTDWFTGLLSMEEKKRLKRFKRERNAFPGMRIQPRDIEILKSLADYRFLDTVQIMALHPGGERNIRRRLQKLFHNGFIDRLGQQLSYTRPLGHMIYALANKGADLLAEHFADFERTKVDWMTKNRETKERYIFHRLMISNFRTVLTLALKNTHQAKLASWRQGRDLKDYVKLDGQRVAVVPDAFFTLEDPQSRMHFFLEADQSTMTRGRFLKKMKAYWQWWKQGGQEKKFDIKSFRVLTICKSEARKENLRQTAKDADDYKKGSLMFWFTSENEIGLSNANRILEPIWQTPASDKYHYILE